MELGKTQQFASPEEALMHYGVKGMRWGVRKKEDSSGDSAPFVPPEATAARNAEEKGHIPLSTFATGNATFRSPSTSTGSQQVTSVAASKDHRLTPTQKKLLIGAAVGTTAFVGYVAYKKYMGGTGPLVDPELAKLVHHPLSDSPLGELGRGHVGFELKDIHGLEINTGRGYADIRPAGGFKNAAVSLRHAEMLDTLDEFRAKYPALKNMNIEVVPMSHVPGMEGLTAAKCPAAVMGIRKGEARLMYNDTFGELSSAEKAYVSTIQPGQLTKNFLGYHELGHMLAVAHGELEGAYNLATQSHDSILAQVRAQQKFKKTQNLRHKALFKRHGLTFKELSKLSKYGATEPSEALAELSGYFHTPEFRKNMDPELARKAEALFKELGGVSA